MRSEPIKGVLCLFHNTPVFYSSKPCCDSSFFLSFINKKAKKASQSFEKNAELIKICTFFGKNYCKFKSAVL